MYCLGKSPYVKTTGISLLLHGMALAFLVALGPFESLSDPSSPAAPPVEIEIVPAAVVDTGDTLSPPAAGEEASAAPRPSGEFRPASRQPVSQQPSAQSLQAAVQHSEPLPPAIPGESGVAPAAQTASKGTGTVETSDAGGGDTAGEAEEAEGQTASSSYLSGAKPAYPQNARQAGWEGTVVLRILVNAGGAAESVTVRDSSGYAVLDEAAVKAVYQWRFSPAKKGGKPVTSFHDIKIRFRLIDAS